MRSAVKVSSQRESRRERVSDGIRSLPDHGMGQCVIPEAPRQATRGERRGTNLEQEGILIRSGRVGYDQNVLRSKRGQCIIPTRSEGRN